jgi:general secretion pathway protein G
MAQFRPRVKATFVLLQATLVFTSSCIVVDRTSPAAMKPVRASQEINEIAMALEAFRVDIGRYPTDSEGLGALLAKPRDLPAWRGPYLTVTSLLDPWGRAYIYRCVQSCQEFVVKSFGADGRAGGVSIDADIIKHSQKIDGR